MSLPYFALYPTNFEAKTAFLSLAEDGAYNRLLRLCWMTPTCSIPADDKWIMRRMRVQEDEYEQVVKPVLDDFFKIKNSRYFNSRLSEEFKIGNAKHKRRVSAGKKGGVSKALKTKNKVSSNGGGDATAKPKQLEPELELELDKKDTTLPRERESAPCPNENPNVLDALSECLHRAAGDGVDWDNSSIAVLSQPLRWVTGDNACEMIDVEQAVLRVTMKRQGSPPIASWNYFRAAVFEERDARLAGNPKPQTPTGTTNAKGNSNSVQQAISKIGERRRAAGVAALEKREARRMAESVEGDGGFDGVQGEQIKIDGVC